MIKIARSHSTVSTRFFNGFHIALSSVDFYLHITSPLKVVIAFQTLL